jgi:hypothetical protein
VTAPLRRAGSGRAPDGARVTWSVAEGGRGRRWRWTIVDDGGVVRHAGLIEVDVDGRFARLELASGAGMLTLHPAGHGGKAHGNVVRPAGVDPIEVDWRDDAGLTIDGDPFGSALGPGAATGAAGEGWSVTAALSLRSAVPDESRLPIDDRGVPVLADAREWPLETD